MTDIVPLTPKERAIWDLHYGAYPFMPIGTSRTRGGYVWPIEEYLVRTRHGPAVRERIARLNRDGKLEGEEPRGWHPHGRSYRFWRDTVPVRYFIRVFGRAAYHGLPKEALMRRGHRKAVATLYAMRLRDCGMTS